MKNQTFVPIPDKIITAALKQMVFSDHGLIPAIAQQHDTGEILMMAWMTAESIRETLSTGRVCYWSRSRKALWRKGETSGQIQTLRHCRYDCDRDTLLLLVDQQGVACHSGRRNCFFNEITPDGIEIISAVKSDPARLYAAKDK
ncbi:MAG: phosphoribosyl-AMP cyclohydrolase [Alphaproteobacteria bacterium]|nr:phosphoribosyl-AMP cyclohydrolase [Alphaproteobacteria bacterium]